MALKVCDTRTEAGKLYVTLEGDSVSELLGSEGRKTAYEERMKHGMERSGVEAVGGTYVDDTEIKAAKKEKRNPRLWRRDFVLTPML